MLSVKDLGRADDFLVGVSGGKDSVTLLHFLLEVGFKNLIVCHLNHGTRKEAKADAAFCRNIAEISHLRFISDNLATFGSKSEAEMRSRRMEFFARVSIETGAKTVFLGHHADDLAETFLWNLLRGSGAEGLRGITSDSQYSTPSGAIRILRPMLTIWREEIDDYIRTHSVKFVEDTTNWQTIYTRNRLRIEVIPWLEKVLDRNVRHNMVRTAEILRDEHDFLDLLAPLPDAECLEVASLRSAAIVLQRRTILKWLRLNNVANAGFKEVEAVRMLLTPNSKVARVNLSQNRQARRRGGKIRLSSQVAKNIGS